MTATRAPSPSGNRGRLQGQLRDPDVQTSATLSQNSLMGSYTSESLLQSQSSFFSRFQINRYLLHKLGLNFT